MKRARLIRCKATGQERHLVPLHDFGLHADRHLLQPAQRASLYLLHISLLSLLALLVYWRGSRRQTKPTP